MDKRKTTSAPVLGPDGKPILRMDGTEATLGIPHPPPAAVLGGVCEIREGNGPVSASVGVYLRRGTHATAYQESRLGLGTVRYVGLPACSECQAEIKTVGCLFVKTMQVAGRLSPEDKRYCLAHYPQN